MLAKLTNLVNAIAELPSALHACVEMAREAERYRKEQSGLCVLRYESLITELETRFSDRVTKDAELVREIDVRLDVERFISDERWAWARERIEALTQEANGLARAAEQERRELAREREARRPRRQSEEPCPLTGDEAMLWRYSGDNLWSGCTARELPGMNADWRYVSPEDMP